MNNLLNIRIGNSLFSYNYRLSYVAKDYSLFLITEEFVTPILWSGEKVVCHFNGKLMGKRFKKSQYREGELKIGDISFKYDITNHILTPCNVQELIEIEKTCCC